MLCVVSAHASINDALESQSEMLEEHPTIRSVAPDPSDERRHHSRWSITNMTMFSGPAVNNLDGHLTNQGGSGGGGGTPSASGGNNSQSRRSGGGGGHGHGHGHQNDQPTGGDVTGTGVSNTTGSSPVPYSPGSSLRNTTTVGYHIDDTYTVGPVIGLSEKLYGGNQHVLLEDPQARFTLADIIHTHIGRGVLRSNIWFAVSAPVSDKSVSQQNVTTLRMSFSPRFQPARSNFSFSMSSSVQVGFFENDTSFAHVLMPSRLFGGIQTAYKISRPLSTYVMTYASQTMGPAIATQADDPATDSARAGGLGKKYGLMTGVMVRPASWMSFSPRANWTFGQPLNTTTLGVNASFTMI